jgi:hypothetical protein
MGSEAITFVSTLPNILSAVRIHGDGSSRIQLEQARSELEEVKKLLDCGGAILSVAIVVKRVESDTADAAVRVVGWKDRR